MEEEIETGTSSAVGERLRAAREEKGLNLEDIAAQTRIPQRHLESLERGDWSRLPAPTYTIGFARSYASAVGLDRTEVSEELRAEMGRQRPATSASEVFEPADPARAMPKWLVFGAIAAVILLVLGMSWLNERSLEDPAASEGNQVAVTAPPPQPVQPQQPPAAAAPQGPVVLTATAPAWIQVSDGGRNLFQGELAQGQSYTVPATATAPRLKAGKPEALTVTIGGTAVPPVGPPGRVASNVSLAPADLMRGPAPAAPSAAPNSAG